MCFDNRTNTSSSAQQVFNGGVYIYIHVSYKPIVVLYPPVYLAEQSPIARYLLRETPNIYIYESIYIPSMEEQQKADLFASTDA